MLQSEAMRTIAIAAQKGGAGKTTIAIHLAVAAAGAYSAIVVDTDPQQSAMGWARIRGNKAPEVFAATPGTIPTLLDAARNDGTALVIIDTPPHSTAEAARVLQAADLIVIPVRPTVLDLMAVEATERLVRASGRLAVAVLSAVPARSPEAADAEQLLEQMGLRVAPVWVKERRAYSRALATGQAVTEFARSRDAAREISDLWAWIDATMVA